MAKTAETYLVKTPDKLGSMNDIWGTTIVLGLSTSNSGAINAGSTNFKYWTQLVAMDSVDEEINLGVFQYPPRPLDSSNFPLNYGAFSVANPLRSFFNVDIANYSVTQPTISNFTDFPNYATSLVKYKMISGYSYNPNLDVEAFQAVVGPNQLLGFSFSSSNYFTIGSNIYVVSDNPYIQGRHTITSDGFTNSSFVTTTAFTSSMSTATPNGTITDYSQNDGNTYIEQLYGFDSVIDYNLYQYGYNFLITNASMSVYPLDGYMWKFLSAFENRKFVYPPSVGREAYFATAKKTRYDLNETATLIVDSDLLNLGTINLYYTGYSSTYSFVENVDFDLSTTISAGTGLQRIDIPIGYRNLSSVFSNIDDIEYFYIRVADALEVDVFTELRTYKIEKDCTIYNPVTLMFMNKLGAFDYWTFTQDSKEVQTITRNEYKREVPYGDMIARGYGYRGQSVLSGKTQQNFTVNSNWISESDYYILNELVRSPEVYVLEYQSSGDTYYPTPIVITDTSYDIKTSIRDQIFNLSISYKMAVDTPIQRK